MCRIIIIGGGVVDGGLGHSGVPRAVPSSDEGDVVQVGRVGHGVLLVLQNLVDDGGELGGVFGRHTAVEHIREVVAVHRAVVEVGHLTRGAARGVGHLGHVADEDEEGGGVALADAGVVEVLHITLDGIVVATSLGGGHHVDVEALLGLPVEPGLQGADVVLGGYHNHVDGIGHQVRVVVIHVHDLAVVEHLLVDDVEVGAVGTQQHALGLGAVGTVKADLHLDVVKHAQGVRHGVVADGVDLQHAHLYAAHRALHLDVGFGGCGQAAGLVGVGVVGEGHVFGTLVLAH